MTHAIPRCTSANKKPSVPSPAVELITVSDAAEAYKRGYTEIAHRNGKLVATKRRRPQ